MRQQKDVVDFLKEPQSEAFIDAARYANDRWAFGVVALALGVIAGCVVYRLASNGQ